MSYNPGQFQKKSKLKRKWRGKPWDHQNHAPMKETRPSYERFVMWFTEGATFDQIADKFGVKWATVQLEFRRNEWKDRLAAFRTFEGAPDHKSWRSMHNGYPPNAKPAELQEEILDAAPMREQRDVEMLDRLDSQIDIVTDAYVKSTEASEKLWKAAQIAIDSIMSDEEKLRGLSITEIKNLVSMAADVNDMRTKYSSQAKTLDKLAEHVSKQLETKRKRRSTR